MNVLHKFCDEKIDENYLSEIGITKKALQYEDNVSYVIKYVQNCNP